VTSLERVRLYHVRMPLVRPFRTSFGEERHRECVLVAVEGAGAVGWGECPATSWPGYSYETAGTAWEVLSAHFVPAALGAAIETPTDLVAALAPYRGHPMARAGLEMAVWDWLGKRQGRSLQEMLGGSGRTVPVGISIGLQPDLVSLRDRIERAVEAGYQRVKLKVEPNHDVEMVEDVRGQFPKLPLQVDANAAYHRDDLPTLARLDDYGLLMIEQPLAEGDWLGHQQLQARVRTPICLDESIHSADDARQAIELDACRVVNIKAGRVGGLTEAVAVHDACRQASIPVWCGGLLETGIGRAANVALASLPGFRFPGDISATDRYYHRDIASPRFELENGVLRVPDGPGLGVSIELDALRQFALRRTDLVAG
jgi:O-succinylbenzoate synthase